MAKFKLSQLPAAASVNPDDLFYAVKGADSVSVTANVLLQRIFNTKFLGNITFDNSSAFFGPRQTIDLSKPISYITVPNSSFDYINLPNGANGQIKILVATSGNGTGSLTLQGNISGPTINFNSKGQSAIVLYSNNEWNIIGQKDTGTVTGIEQYTYSNVQINSLGVGVAPSGVQGEIRAINNITAYYSDDRLKTNLGQIKNALDKVKTLSGFYFEANETAKTLGYTPIRDVGVSAQKVQNILPEAVVSAPIDDKYLTVRYEKIIPLLIEAIKEIDSKVSDLSKKIENLGQ